jgi:hypothetical protein
MRTVILGLVIALSAQAASAAPLAYRFIQTGATADSPFEEWTRKATARIVVDAEVGVGYEVLHYIDESGFIDTSNIPTSSNLGPLIEFHVDFENGGAIHVTPETDPGSYFLSISFTPLANRTLDVQFFAGNVSTGGEPGGDLGIPFDNFHGEPADVQRRVTLRLASDSNAACGDGGNPCMAEGFFRLDPRRQPVPEPYALALVTLGALAAWRIRGARIRR